MVVAVTSQIRFDDSILQKIKKDINTHNKLRIGIIDNPKEAQIGWLQHEGGVGKYYYGPYKDEEVDIPPRPFVQAPFENYAEDIVKRVFDSSELTTEGISLMKERVGNWLAAKMKEHIGNVELAKSLNPKANGDGRNSARTIITKGFDHPLLDKGNLISAIKYEVK